MQPNLPQNLAAILFDVDGTLYEQSGLRRAMLLRLLRGYCWQPVTGMRTMRLLQAYRRAQEHLREGKDANAGPAEQLRVACSRAGVSPAIAGPLVARWMEEEPLMVLPRFRRPFLLELLQYAQQRGWKLGVFSDYPAAGKLTALGVAGFFPVTVCAQDEGVNSFKPNPHGLLVAAQRMAVPPANVLYIGDRWEVDVPAAQRAGMIPGLIGVAAGTERNGVFTFSGYHEVLASLRRIPVRGGAE